MLGVDFVDERRDFAKGCSLNSGFDFSREPDIVGVGKTGGYNRRADFFTSVDNFLDSEKKKSILSL